MSSEHDSIHSPCIGHCCLDDDDICVGCKRHITEITAWQGASHAQKLMILKHCIERGNIALKSYMNK